MKMVIWESLVEYVGEFCKKNGRVMWFKKRVGRMGHMVVTGFVIERDRLSLRVNKMFRMIEEGERITWVLMVSYNESCNAPNLENGSRVGLENGRVPAGG
jgi:hypothetical protein